MRVKQRSTVASTSGVSQKVLAFATLAGLAAATGGTITFS